MSVVDVCQLCMLPDSESKEVHIPACMGIVLPTYIEKYYYYTSLDVFKRDACSFTEFLLTSILSSLKRATSFTESLKVLPGKFV